MTPDMLGATIVVGGIQIGVRSRREWAERIVNHAAARPPVGRRPKLVYAANGQVVYLYATDPVFRAQFRKADAVTADGQPIVWASRLTRSPLPERAATTDLFHDVARAAEREERTFFLLGSSEENNANAADRIGELYPNLRIVGRRNGYFSRDDEAEIVQTLRELKPDILWVGLGVKMQLDFVTRNVAALEGVGCVVTCGGLFDYFSTRVRRAPLWMQDHALEWLFRAWQEPRKYVMRYLVTNPVAALLLLTRTHRCSDRETAAVAGALWDARRGA